MSPEKTEQLYTRFPKLYVDAKATDEYGRFISILGQRGIECDDGWFQIIWSLSKKINDLCKAAKIPAADYPQVQQIKEKFGGLRFYVSHLPEAISERVFHVITTYEKHSFETCEICGKKGKLREDRRWLRTLCDAHAAERAEKSAQKA